MESPVLQSRQLKAHGYLLGGCLLVVVLQPPISRSIQYLASQSQPSMSAAFFPSEFPEFVHRVVHCTRPGWCASIRLVVERACNLLVSPAVIVIHPSARPSVFPCPAPVLAFVDNYSQALVRWRNFEGPPSCVVARARWARWFLKPVMCHYPRYNWHRTGHRD